MILVAAVSRGVLCGPGGNHFFVFINARIRHLEENTILDDVFLFMPDRSIRQGAIAFTTSGIIAVGDKSSVHEKAGKKSRIIPLQGALAIPGIADCHTHMLSGALQFTRVDLRAVKSRDEFSSRIQAWVKENPSLPWILGQWADTFLGRNLPGRDWVDIASRDKPLFLTRFDMHSAVANTKALETAGIHKGTPDPPGGKIVRDPRTGEPTGLLLERAMELVTDRIPHLPDAERIKALQKAFRIAHSLGITQVHDVAFHSKNLDIYRAALENEPGLKAFVRVPYQEMDYLLSARDQEATGRLILDGVKGFIDGSLGSTTAWLEEPYAHNPSFRGMSCMEDRGEFQAQMKRAAQAGFSVSLHAIGDAAIGFGLDLFHEIIREGRGNAPLRIEHFQHPGRKHIERTGHPRLFASIQPSHLLDDAGPAEERLGPERAALSYPIKSLLDRGCPVVFGSDWDVADLNPLVGLQAAVARVDKAGRFPGGWHPEQCISISVAIECYTSTAARATPVPQKAGKLTAGMEANLTILDRDITSIPIKEILKAKVIMTVTSGHIVHRAY